ncbi:uncharacterized protein BYT42DRAFT_569360 [Radiomyces spectabilis]|uniref:uncharacterized protein n=1 Tax=Radiomyces spectabilis TaxID=64574 RepID=UPI002220036F|nr:uncharacterized protein BYT42DRAFT_569360 [Radiomyces spectabilis]KAI8379601.1 hypothetical protein BYT42DRAFT_569360 [Radiomyces spectabilis]
MHAIASRRFLFYVSFLSQSLPKRWYKNLGTCLLIGTLEVRYAQHGMKSKRYGCALFNSYMIIVKAKKHKQYEPRYWFPLRLFNLENMHDHEAVSCGWILRNDNQILEFSSICEQEKRIWMDTLGHAIEQTRKQHNENDSDPVEKLFVSSFDQYTAQVSTPMSASTSYASFQSSVARQDSLQGTPRSSTMPNALTDDALLDSEEKQTKNRSLSAVYDKSADSIPPLTSDPSSSSLRARSSVSDFKDFFSANITEKWSHHKYNQYHARRLSIDIKFEDVCTTPILTARSQARQDYGSSYEQWRRRSQLPKTASMMSFSDVYDFVSPSSSSPSPHHTYYGSTSSSPRYHSFGDSLLNVVRRKSSLPTRINGDYYDYPSHPSHQRSLPMRRLQVPPPSRSTLDGGVSSLSPLHPTDSMIFRLSQRSQDNLQPSRPHPEATLPAVANHATLPRSSSHFFGKMKEKFGHLSTPRGVRRNGLNAPTAVRVPKTNAKSGNMAAPSPSTSDHRVNELRQSVNRSLYVTRK